MDLYKKNISVLSEKQPVLMLALKKELEKFEAHPDGTDGETFKWVLANNQKNFTYTRANPPFSAGLYCGANPEAETLELIKGSQLDHPSALVILGLGLGYGLKAFLKDRPHTNFCILVIEKNPQIFLRALCIFDWTEEFSDESISWIVGSDMNEVSRDLITFFKHNSTVDRYLKILPTPAALAGDNEFYQAVAEALLKMRDFAVILAGNSIPDQLLGVQNAVTNIPYTIDNPGVLPIHNKFIGKVCVSIAAGPSANEHFETLKTLQGKVPLIACESIVKPLHAHGIYPDFITAIERDDYVPKFFRNIEFSERSSLVAPMILMKECFDLYKGSKIIYTPALGWPEPFGLEYLGTLSSGSSAGNLNLAIAKHMGFKTVIMVGHNLAYGYQTNETHVKGTIDPDRERSRTHEELMKESQGQKRITQDGTAEVWSRIEWDMFRTQMEAFISETPEMDFINTAAKGSRISGSKLMTFVDALEKFKQEPFDIYPEKAKLLKPLTKVEVDERIERVKSRTTHTLESIKKWREKSQEILKKLDKWEKKISEKELKGSRVSIEFLDTAIDEVLDLKVNAVNNDRFFYASAIIIMIPAHMAFERSLNEMRAHYKEDYPLKKDFLLKHKQYFGIWNETLPLIIPELEKLLAHFETDEFAIGTTKEGPRPSLSALES